MIPPLKWSGKPACVRYPCASGSFGLVHLSSTRHSACSNAVQREHIIFSVCFDQAHNKHFLLDRFSGYLIKLPHPRNWLDGRLIRYNFLIYILLKLMVCYRKMNNKQKIPLAVVYDTWLTEGGKSTVMYWVIIANRSIALLQQQWDWFQLEKRSGRFAEWSSSMLGKWSLVYGQLQFVTSEVLPLRASAARVTNRLQEVCTLQAAVTWTISSV